jgi:hypothetical protein
MLTLPGNPLTRRQFFGRLRTLGFKKAPYQMTRVGLTYVKEENGDRVTVTVPKHHEQTFHILGDVPYSGIFVQAIDGGREVNWGIPVRLDDLGFANMLEVCIALCSGNIELVQQPLNGRQEGGRA